MFKVDGDTPSGVRLVVQAGSFDWQIRYCLKGPEHRFFFASSLLDLVVQTTKEASSLNGMRFVMDRWVRLQDEMVTRSFFGNDYSLDRLENFLGVLIASR